MHAFLISCALYGTASLIGLLLMVKDGDRITVAAMAVNLWSLSIGAGAVVFLIQGR